MVQMRAVIVATMAVPPELLLAQHRVLLLLL